MKEAIHSKMRARAYEMARSGEHGIYVTIEFQLRREFPLSPRFLFEHPFDKAHFDEICRGAQADKKPSA
jgi:hypothetical protein